MLNIVFTQTLRRGGQRENKAKEKKKKKKKTHEQEGTGRIGRIIFLARTTSPQISHVHTITLFHYASLIFIYPYTFTFIYTNAHNFLFHPHKYIQIIESQRRQSQVCPNIYTIHKCATIRIHRENSNKLNRIFHSKCHRLILLPKYTQSQIYIRITSKRLIESINELHII